MSTSAEPNPSRTSISRWPAWVQLSIVLLPALVFLLVLAKTYTPVPIIDDWDQMFAWALAFHAEPGSGAKLLELFGTQTVAYKLIFEHALAALQLELLGHLSWPPLIWLSNLFPLGIFALLALHADEGHAPRRERLASVLFPVSCLFFGLNYAETMSWVACGLQYQVVIFFSLSALHFLIKTNRPALNLSAAVLCGILATSAFPNGMLVWIAGLAYLLLTDRRALAVRLSGWGAGFAASLGMYLFRYQRAAALATSGTIGSKIFFLVNWLGAGLENMHHRPVPYVSFVIGLAIVVTFGHAVWTRYDLRNPFAFYTAVWVFLTSVVVTSARVSFGLSQSLSSRYKIYCDLLLVFCFLYGLDQVKTSRVRLYLRIASIVALAYFLAGTVAGAKLLSRRYVRVESAMHAYLADPLHASPMALADDGYSSPAELATKDRARIQMNEMVRLGLYTPPHP